jgi:NitT/TauT family transport system substrate-binding protein
VKSVWIFVVSVLLLLTGCSDRDETPPLKISANAWIGYVPLFYAQEKGWLERDGFSLKYVSSLSESLNLYTTHSVDAMASTQYEYFESRNVYPGTVPVILLDRSDGGDMILANMPEARILASKGPIDVYLEQQSINIVLLRDFARERGLTKKRLHFIETNPDDYRRIRFDPGKPTLVVTYAPYHLDLLAKGFRVIASTASLDSLLVIDAVFTDRETLSRHRDRFTKLKNSVDRAVERCQKDPEEVYRTVKPYFEHFTYDDFRNDLNAIEWINRPDETILSRITRHGIDTEMLLK